MAPELPTEENIQPTHIIRHPTVEHQQDEEIDDNYDQPMHAGYMPLDTENRYMNSEDEDDDEEDSGNDTHDIEFVTPTVSVDSEQNAQQEVQGSQQTMGTTTTTPCSNVPPIESADSEISRAIWNQPRPENSQIELDNTKTEQIMNVMSNITLPNIAIPMWAVNVPEERWKEELLQRIRDRSDARVQALSSPPAQQMPNK